MVDKAVEDAKKPHHTWQPVGVGRAREVLGWEYLYGCLGYLGWLAKWLKKSKSGRVVMVLGNCFVRVLGASGF